MLEQHFRLCTMLDWTRGTLAEAFMFTGGDVLRLAKTHLRFLITATAINVKPIFKGFSCLISYDSNFTVRQAFSVISKLSNNLLAEKPVETPKL